MANKKGKTVPKKSNSTLFISIGAIIVLIVVVFAFKGVSGNKGKTTADSDLVIPKSEISETIKFFPYKSGKTNMEIIAVKASDGTIRTAFNTCQVCFDSGRGYYKVEGDILICQNCKNRFRVDQIEKEKGGCNPVPIFEENKKDDGTNIVISKDLLAQAKELFANWKTR